MYLLPSPLLPATQSSAKAPVPEVHPLCACYFAYLVSLTAKTAGLFAVVGIFVQGGVGALPFPCELFALLAFIVARRRVLKEIKRILSFDGLWRSAICLMGGSRVGDCGAEIQGLRL